MCRGCLTSIGRKNASKETLAERVEKRRQEKILREELKRIARQRIDARKRKRASDEKKKAVEKLLPKLETISEVVEVDAATREIARRVLQKRRLVEFAKEFHPKYKPGWVHVDICRRLEKFSEDVRAGKSPRLMILMPPRHGKSKLASVLFPAWHLGHAPDHEIIACAYAISLPLDFSREVRGVIAAPRYATLFPNSKLDPNRQGAEAWKMASATGIGSGGYVAAGVGGPINGKGAHVLVIDDPIKNAEEASSVDHLRKVMDWYDSTAYTRLAPGGGVLLIMTWWSDMDPAGQLQERAREDPEADQFEVIKYPAIATEDEEFRLKGEALHPERFPLEALEKIKRVQGGDKGRWWNALYQQNPIPDEGAMFTKDMFVWRDGAPEYLDSAYRYQAWDFAIGEKRLNDYTVGVTIAVDYDDTAHVVDLVRFRSSDQLKIADAMLDMYARHSNVLVLGVEDGQIWRGVKAHLDKRMQERRLMPTVEELKPLTDKLLRAQPLQGRMQQHKLTFPKNGDWVPVVMKEFLRFPVGMHDDTVDAIAWCMKLALARSAPTRPSYRQRGGEKTVAEKLRALGLGGGGGSGGHMEA